MSRALALLALVAACTDSAEPAITGNSRVEWIDIPVRAPTPYDVLFVIDDVADLVPYRDRIVASYSHVTGVFNPASTRPDLHVAVMTPNGAFRASERVHGNYIADIVHEDYSNERNYVGTLPEALASLGRIEGSSAANPQLLERVVRTLESPEAATFVRPEAMLYLVILTARDDASPLPVADYLARLNAIKPGYPGIIFGIAHAGPTPRLDELATLVPFQSVTVSLPDRDPAEAMNFRLELIQPIGPPCIETPGDRDFGISGIQPECSAFVTHFGSVEGSVLPGCDTSGSPCWWWKPAPLFCRPEQPITLGVNFGEARLPRGGHLVVQCELEP